MMDTDNALPPPSTRRRVTRNGNISLGSSHAGPSRLEFSSTNGNLNLGEEPSRNLLSSFSDMDMDMDTPVVHVEDTPAARLRAIMNRIPPDTSTRADAPPASPSDRESDFDLPNFASSAGSSYRGSLKSLMDRALRPAGDTPQKAHARPRRNSIDTSEVDSSPRVANVRRERAGAIEKRKSHSDEEVETKTPTAIHDIFNEHTPNVSIEFSGRGFNSQATPPAASSTPHGSMHSLTSFLNTHSNLLDLDSEMHRGLQGVDSLSDDEVAPFPASKKNEDTKGTIRPRGERSSSSPSQSASFPKNDSTHDDHDSVRRNLTRSPTSHRHSRIPISPTRFLRDRASSIHSVGSNGSLGDVHERDTHSLHDHESERQWDKPRPRTLSKPTPSNTSNSRSRTYSQPTRPHHYSPAPSPQLRQHQPSLSRSSSSASLRSSDSGQEVDEEVVHERERNWNSNRPTWHRNPSFSSDSRPNSPAPGSSAATHPSATHDHLHVSRTHSSQHLSPRPHSSIHARAASPSPSHVQRPRPLSFPARSSSPLPPIHPSTSPTALRPRSGTPSSLRRTSTTELKPSPRNGRVRTTSSLSSILPSTSPSASRSSTHPAGNDSHSPFSFHSASASSSKVSPSQQRRASKVTAPYDGQSTGSPFVTSTDSMKLNAIPDTDNEDAPPDSTPTLKTTVPLKADSPEMGRKLSPLQVSMDEARLHRAAGASHSPPLSPSTSASSPPTPPTALPLFETPSTPPQLDLKALEYKTPSPPAGLPELPGPPSSDEDHDVSHLQEQNTATKTPRPPGGWMFTPAPVRPRLLARTSSLPVDEDNQSDQSELTPQNTTPLSRAQSLPAQTPAPPGGWLMTPAAQKKSVRFDSIQELEASTDQDAESLAPSEVDEPRTRQENGILKSSSIPNTETSAPSTPPLSPTKSRRQARIRIVDEYGREQSPPKVPSDNAWEDAQRSKSAIRIVDAMGRLVEDSVVEGDDTADTVASGPFLPPKTRTEGMARMQNDLTQLEQLVDHELDRTSAPIDTARILELQNVTSASRQQRRQLKSDIDANLRAVRKSMNEVMSVMESRSSSQSHVPLAKPKNNLATWVSWITFGVLMQMVLFWVMHSMTLARAYDIFVTTYYDPFSPELYMYHQAPGGLATSHDASIFRSVIASVRGVWEVLFRPPERAVIWGTS